MRAFFYRTADGLHWRIATQADRQKPDGHLLTILNTPVNANDELMLSVVKQKNPENPNLTYSELMQ